MYSLSRERLLLLNQEFWDLFSRFFETLQNNVLEVGSENEKQIIDEIEKLENELNEGEGNFGYFSFNFLQDKSEGTHLVVFVHGLHGGVGDFIFMKEELTKVSKNLLLVQFIRFPFISLALCYL